jgi:CO dehydrogenase/acetyl-CoA synthase epsilon subunit
MPQLETANDPKSFDCMISRARRCILAAGHAITDEYGRLLFNHKRERTDNKV